MAIDEQLLINKINIENEKPEFGSSEHENKLERVLRYLNKDYDNTFKDHLKLVRDIKYTEQKISEIYNAIAVSEKDVDPNFSLFSPVKTTKGELNTSLYEEVHILENNLQEMKFNEKKLIARLENITDIIQCLNYRDEIKNYKEMESLADKASKINEKDIDDISQNSASDDSKISISENNNETGLSVLQFQEMEREQLALELHVQIVQNLTALIHKCQLCSKLVDMDVIRTKLELQSMISTIKTMSNSMKEAIYDIKPMDESLSVIVRKYISKLHNNTGIIVSFNLINEVKEKEKDPTILLTCFRIIQEACNNSINHSDCKNIYITLNYDQANDSDFEIEDKENEGKILLIVEDDGCGFDVDEDDNIIINKDGTYGITLMKERVRLCNGKIEIGNNETGSARVKVII